MGRLRRRAGKFPLLLECPHCRGQARLAAVVTFDDVLLPEAVLVYPSYPLPR